jgi:hypothetical protein
MSGREFRCGCTKDHTDGWCGKAAARLCVQCAITFTADVFRCAMCQKVHDAHGTHGSVTLAMMRALGMDIGRQILTFSDGRVEVIRDKGA